MGLGEAADLRPPVRMPRSSLVMALGTNHGVLVRRRKVFNWNRSSSSISRFERDVESHG